MTEEDRGGWVLFVILIIGFVLGLAKCHGESKELQAFLVEGGKSYCVEGTVMRISSEGIARTKQVSQRIDNVKSWQGKGWSFWFETVGGGKQLVHFPSAAIRLQVREVPPGDRC